MKTFAGGPALIEALFACEVDIGFVGSSSAINGFVKSKGDALRVIAGCVERRGDVHRPARSDITTPADLAGRTFARRSSVARRTSRSATISRRTAWRPRTTGGTVQILPTQPANIFALFREGTIDGA